ncbi:hypothetical protein CCO03_06380 [Comamonas serinivorans]|uniref:DUF2134 domain-containing protein n=1 Tax=Comamonas serinivorans TaxID=1082851 RepID=A0A1Y0ELX4_9BURK|nr:hypothetical protein CCO03_06380 [Comamonas serinivorans]
MLVQFALLAALLIAVLGAVQIGYMYYAKRDLQRMADIAALEATNALAYGVASTCPDAQAAATQSLNAQQRLSLDDEVRTIDCGHWNASLADASRFNPNYGDAPTRPLNATRVTLQGETLQLLPFTGSRVVAATATAAKNDEPVAAFTVGSQLLRFNSDSVLGLIAQRVGLDITRLTVLDKDGIANARITPAGLLQFLGLPVGVNDLALLTPNDLANVDASVLDLIDAAINAGDNLLNAGVDLAELVNLRAYLAAFQLANVKVPLGGDNGLLAMISAGGNASPIGAGLDAVVDLADLVRTQLAIANGTNSVALTNTGIPGLAEINLTIVEPPALAVGPAKPAITKAYNAQVRLNLQLLSMGGLPVLGSLLPLDLSVDLVNGEGTLEKISCQQTPKTADISVQSSVGKICLGKRNGTNCEPTQVLLGLVTVKAEANLLPASSETITDIPVDTPKDSQANNLQIGSTVSSLIDNLELRLIGINLAPVTDLVGAILKPALVPILNGLGSFLSGTVLQEILGIQLGRTTIEVLDIQCDTAQLVH